MLKIGYTGSNKVIKALCNALNRLDKNKQNQLVQGENITLTDLEDGTTRIDADGGGGTVTDVLVDGESVIEQDSTIAKINLLGKQDVLIPGNNIIIEDNIISSDAEPNITGMEPPTSEMGGDGAIYMRHDDLHIRELHGKIGGKWMKLCSSSVLAPAIYSFAEREVGVWTDKKPLYQKTYAYSGQLTVNEDFLDITSDYALFDTVVLFLGTATTNFGENICLPHAFNNLAYENGMVILSDGRIRITKGTGFSYLENIYITICYTKTSDEPGTGKWDESGLSTFMTGMDAPKDSFGSDGNTYVQYNGSYINTYYKIDGQWVQMLKNANDIYY